MNYTARSQVFVCSMELPQSIRILVAFVLFNLIFQVAPCQRAQQFMLAAHADLIKSDNNGFFEKMQGGFEGSYYLSRKFAATTAIEWWTGKDLVVVAGARFCPIDEAFIRVRGLIGEDFSFGGGFAKPLSGSLRIEAMADYYLEGPLAIRAGIAYGLGRNP